MPAPFGDEAVKELFPAACAVGNAGAIRLFETDGWLLGSVILPLAGGEPIEIPAEHAYREILRAIKGFHPARFWNNVPHINNFGPDGLENYRSFCRGRAQAFEQHFGPDYKKFLPAASAVGCLQSAFSVGFAACAVAPRHIENPLQVPAYEYPSEHGPRAPSFARATVVPAADLPMVFISGTAAIRGHATVAPDSTPAQLTCTLENLREISLACGLGPELAAGAGHHRHFKVYLRTHTDQPAVAGYLNRELLRPEDKVSYLHADICRSPLRIEIEASLLPHTPHEKTTAPLRPPRTYCRQ